MKQVDSNIEEYRDQFNAPIIAYRCPECDRTLALLSASNSEHAMFQGIPALELLDMKAEGIEKRHVLALQIEPYFIWSYKENRYVHPAGYDGKRAMTKHDRTEIKGNLKEMKRILDLSLCLEHRRPQLEKMILQTEEMLQNLSSTVHEEKEIIYQHALLKYPDKFFDCCEQSVLVAVLKHGNYVLAETNANPRMW